MGMMPPGVNSTEKKLRAFSYFKGLDPYGHDGKGTIPIPAKDTAYLYDKCFMAAAQYVGYKNVYRLYKIEDNARETDAVAHFMLSLLFIHFYQDGDHSMMVKVANELLGAFQRMRATRSNGKVKIRPRLIIEHAYAIATGDTSILK